MAAIPPHFAYYSLVKTNRAARMTPSKAAGVDQSAWTLAIAVERKEEK
jgi:hypothetical protein